MSFLKHVMPEDPEDFWVETLPIVLFFLLVLGAVGFSVYHTVATRCIRWDGVDAYGNSICVERKK